MPLSLAISVCSMITRPVSTVFQGQLSLQCLLARVVWSGELSYHESANRLYPQVMMGKVATRKYGYYLWNDAQNQNSGSESIGLPWMVLGIVSVVYLLFITARLSTHGYDA